MATKAEKELRVAKISELLLRGATRPQILQYASTKTNWGVTDRSVDTYIKHATQAIKEGAATDTDYEIGKAKERYEFLWQQAIRVNDYREARGVQKDRSALLGLDAPKKLDVSSDEKLDVTIRYESSDNAPEDARSAAKDKDRA